MKINKKRELNIMNNSSMHLFTMLCGYFLLVLVLYFLFQIINFTSCLGIIQILSIIIPIIAYLLLKKDNKKIKEKIIIISIYLVILLIIPFIVTKTYDLTYDGNNYHKTAVAFIKNGWNPLYEDTRDFQKNNENVFKIRADSKTDIWVEHYPKATWVIGATIYNMTGNIESGKCVTLIFTIMLLIISYNCLATILSKKWAIAISLLLALNPINVAQIYTYYVDGLMGVLFTIELFLLMMINPKEKQNILIWISLAGVCAVFCNIKFTGLLASGVLAAVYYFYWLIKYRKEKEFPKLFWRITRNFIIVFATAIFAIGANSYVKNSIDHLNPLYPLFGKDKEDIITYQQPELFKDKNVAEKFVISMFSRTKNVIYGMNMKPEWKWPFQVSREEIHELYAVDVRIAGFGPLYAAMFLISVVILAINSYILYKNEKQSIKYITLPLIAVLVSMVLIGESWWARYVPQFYLLIIGTITLAVYNLKYINKKFFYKLMITGICSITILNLSCFIYINLRQLGIFYNISKEIVELKNKKDNTFNLRVKELTGYYYTLRDNDVVFNVDENLKEEDSIQRFNWQVFEEAK